MPVLNVKQSFSLKKWFHRTFFQEKLNNPIGYLIGSVLAIGLAIVLSLLPLKMGLMVVGGLLAVPFAFYCFANLSFGILIILVLGFLVSFIGKYTAAPVGMAIDGILLIILFSLLVRLVKERDLSFLKHPLTYAVLAWIWYNCMLAINPWAQSYKAWFFTVRTMALYFSLFFVAAYAIDSMKKVKLFIKAIICLATISALYSLKQEFIGYSNTEMNWLRADPYRFQLNYQWGRIRVFSFFSDPTTFGILMAYMAMFCSVLFFGAKKRWQKAALAFAVFCMMGGIAFAGSRTPVALIPIGIFFYMLMTFKKETIIGAGIIILLGAAVMLKSTSNPVLFRLQSAFQPKDASYQLRLNDQDRIQPYIQSNPFGLGLGCTGMWGQRFNPGTFLAKFDHNSMYVRIAVEGGYVGLIVYLILFFMILKTGIQGYFRSHDPTIKNYFLAISSMLFLLSVANYPQEAATLAPTSFILYVFMAILVRLPDFDTR